MEESLTEIVRKTEVTNKIDPESFDARTFEKRVLDAFEGYEKESYPNGRGGVKPLSPEERRLIYAQKIFLGVLNLASHGLTEKAREYAAKFDGKFTLKDVKNSRRYEDGF